MKSFVRFVGIVHYTAPAVGKFYGGQHSAERHALRCAADLGTISRNLLVDVMGLVQMGLILETLNWRDGAIAQSVASPASPGHANLLLHILKVFGRNRMIDH